VCSSDLEPSFAVVGVAPAVASEFGAPCTVAPDGFFIDVDVDAAVSASRTNDADRLRIFRLLSGLIGSTLEKGIWDEAYPEGMSTVSTTRVLELANRQGVPVYWMTNENAARIMPMLQLPEKLKTDLADAVAQGHMVLVPREQIADGSWQGTGYVALDPTTCSMGCMLSSGTAGGEAKPEEGQAPPGYDPTTDPEVIAMMPAFANLGMDFLLGILLVHVAMHSGIAALTIAPLVRIWPYAIGLLSFGFALYRIVTSTLDPWNKSELIAKAVGAAVMYTVGCYALEAAKWRDPGQAAFLAMFLAAYATVMWGMIFPLMIEDSER